MDFKNIIGHEDIISHFRSNIEQNKVSHAYIIGGEDGSGKSVLAHSFAKALQCENGGSESCGECKSCKQAESGNHPDIIYVTHEKPNTISVEEIREQVVDSMQIKPYSSKYKVYIIKEADRMTESAENALLKTIEEPPEYAVILILTSNVEKLLPTIRSRCVTITTRPIKEKDIRDYLLQNYDVDEKKIKFAVEYAQGNLGKAVLLATNEEYEELIQSVIKLETNIFDMDMEDISDTLQHCSSFKMSINEYLDLMMMWYRDILVLKVTGNPDKILFKEQYSIIREQSNYLSFNELEAKSQSIINAKARINANAKMEDIMRLLIMTLKEK
ncbi:MAG: DNA polymerase III subunit delta' [Eubacterium sp.]|nr:DNA polymerase III subunit delta' [Eubacterium sp.]